MSSSEEDTEASVTAESVTESSSHSSDYSDDSLSDNENYVHYLSSQEFYVELPVLFNSTRRRKKDKYSLYPQLANKIYRCKEYPHGIYINSYGELREDDPRTGMYQIDDNYVQHCKEYEMSEKEEEYEDDLKNSESSDEEYAEHEEYEEHEEVKKKPLNKKRKCDHDNKTVSSSPPAKKRPKIDPNILKELKDHESEQLKIIEQEQSLLQQRLAERKLIDCVEMWCNTWPHAKKELETNKKNSIIMETDCNIVFSDQPQCTFEFFRKKKKKNKVYGFMNMKNPDNPLIVIQNNDKHVSFNNMHNLYKYIQQLI